MARRDLELLTHCQHSNARAGKVLNKSRQAISKGVNGDDPYFDAEDVKLLYAHAAVTSEEERANLKAFISRSFEEFADRILFSASELKMSSSIEAAEVIWIIAPNLSSNLSQAKGQMNELIRLVKSRSKLDVVLFAEKLSDVAAFEKRLTKEWFEKDRENRLDRVDCRIIEKQHFMVVTAPKTNPECFTLAEPFFALLPAHEGQRLMDSLLYEIGSWLKEEGQSADEPEKLEREHQQALIS